MSTDIPKKPAAPSMITKSAADKIRNQIDGLDERMLEVEESAVRHQETATKQDIMMKRLNKEFETLTEGLRNFFKWAEGLPDHTAFEGRMEKKFSTMEAWTKAYFIATASICAVAVLITAVTLIRQVQTVNAMDTRMSILVEQHKADSLMMESINRNTNPNYLATTTKVPKVRRNVLDANQIKDVAVNDSTKPLAGIKF